ncbi:hypothetical protein AAE478_001449 [Parahypoxylon ruwenzoriense]
MTSVNVRPPPLASLINIPSRDVFHAAFQIANFFVPYPSYQFVAVAGSAGQQGGALLYRHKRADGSILQQIIVKYYTIDSVQQSADEWVILNSLRGAEHIVQLIGTGRYQLGTTYALIQEYVMFGTLGDMLQRYSEFRQAIPNRILFNVFLCLIRACIAMKYPPRLHANQGIRRETLPASRIPATNIQHNDLHFGNVLIAEPNMNDREHTLGPFLKVIDFGEATLVEEDEELRSPVDTHDDLSTNIYEVGSIIMNLAIGGDLDPIMPGREVTVHTANGPLQMVTEAPQEIDQIHITRELRDLICRCMASEIDDYPDLQEALDICQRNVLEKTENDFSELPGGGIIEKNSNISRMLNAVVYEANLNEEAQARRFSIRLSAPPWPGARKRSSIGKLPTRPGSY